MNASPAVATPPIEKGETVVGRIIATGAVVLQTAAHFGGGPGDTTDAALLRDGDGQPFIPGASIAGALRSFLRQRTVGAVGTSLEQRERYAHMLSTLFGGRETPPKQDPAEASRTVRNSEGFQSMLAVDDAFLSPNADQRALTVLRDRVRIDPERRTAADHGKFDYEALEPGAAFTVRLEFTLREAHRDLHSELKRLFNVILDALTAQEIRLGAHTRRGLGRCSVERWSVLELDFREPRDVLRWLRDDEPDDDCPQRCGGTSQWDAFATLPLDGALLIGAVLELAGPLLQRSDEVASLPDQAAMASASDHLLHLPDVVQLMSGGRPVVSGTALAGVLRHRAVRICRTLNISDSAADRFVANMWGPLLHEKSGGDGQDTDARASRLIVDEAFIEGGELQRQTRIAIDRFTGGARESALLEEAPVWPRHDRPATLQMRLRLLPDSSHLERFAAECGLLLLLVKDLCTGDLPLGGSASVGRGVVRGRAGSIDLRTAERRLWRWMVRDEGDLTFDRGDPRGLEAMVQAFVHHAEEGNDAERSH